MSLSAAEKDALLEPGLNVDPTQMDGGMEAVSALPSGGDEPSEHLQAAIDEYGKEATMAAYNHGWRPKGEHKGNPDNFVTPIGFLARYAETADKRAKREADEQATQRIKGIAEAAQREVQSLKKRMDKVDDADREATKRHFSNLIADAAGDPEKIEKLLEQRDKALKDIEVDDAPAQAQPATDPEAIKLFEAHPQLRDPKTADDRADQAWAAARAQELETRYPNATLGDVLRQVNHDLTQRKNGGQKPTERRGRTLSDDNAIDSGASGGGKGGKVTIGTMTADQRNAFAEFVEMGVYKDTVEGKQRYVDGLNLAMEEEAAKYA